MSPRPGDSIHTPALDMKALVMNTALGLCKGTAGYQRTEGKQRHSASKSRCLSHLISLFQNLGTQQIESFAFYLLLYEKAW